MSLSWPEIAFWSHQRSWRRCPRRRKSFFFAQPTRMERKKMIMMTSACDAIWAPATVKPTKPLVCLSTDLTTASNCKHSIMLYSVVFFIYSVYIIEKTFLHHCQASILASVVSGHATCSCYLIGCTLKRSVATKVKAIWTLSVALLRGAPRRG